MAATDLEIFVDGAHDGFTNMARDRALWREREEGRSDTAFLRVYAWSPPALSLGFHQRDDEVDSAWLRGHGVDLVRRPTGGAAVLHWDEITYSLCAPLGRPGLGRSVAEIYESVARALVEALGQFGVAAERGGGGRPTGFACFDAAGGHEITVAGRKLVGSAQRRGRRAFLQHGSLLTGPGHLKLYAALAGAESGASARLEERTTDLSRLGHGDLTRTDFALGLGRALADATSARVWRREELKPEVSARAHELVAASPSGSRLKS